MDVDKLTNDERVELMESACELMGEAIRNLKEATEDLPEWASIRAYLYADMVMCLNDYHEFLGRKQHTLHSVLAKVTAMRDAEWAEDVAAGRRCPEHPMWVINEGEKCPSCERIEKRRWADAEPATEPEVCSEHNQPIDPDLEMCPVCAEIDEAKAEMTAEIRAERALYSPDEVSTPIDFDGIAEGRSPYPGAVKDKPLEPAVVPGNTIAKFREVAGEARQQAIDVVLKHMVPGTPFTLEMGHKQSIADVEFEATGDPDWKYDYWECFVDVLEFALDRLYKDEPSIWNTCKKILLALRMVEPMNPDQPHYEVSARGTRKIKPLFKKDGKPYHWRT